MNYNIIYNKKTGEVIAKVKNLKIAEKVAHGDLAVIKGA